MRIPIRNGAVAFTATAVPYNPALHLDNASGKLTVYIDLKADNGQVPAPASSFFATNGNQLPRLSAPFSNFTVDYIWDVGGLDIAGAFSGYSTSNDASLSQASIPHALADGDDKRMAYVFTLLNPSPSKTGTIRFIGSEGNSGSGSQFNKPVSVGFPSYGANLANDGTNAAATLPNAGDPDTVGVHVKVKNNGNAPLSGVTFEVESVPPGSTALNTGCTTAMSGYTCALNLAVTPALVTFNPPLTTLGHSGSGTDASEYVLRYQLPSGYTQQQQHTITHKIAGTENKVGGAANALSLNTVVQKPAAPPPPQPATVSYSNLAPASGSTIATLPASVSLDVAVNNSATGAAAIAAGAATYAISGLPAGLAPASFTCTGSVCGAITVTGTGMSMPLGAIGAGQNASFTLAYNLPAATAGGTYSTAHGVTGAGVATNTQAHNYTIAAAGLANASYSQPAIVAVPATVTNTVTVNNSAGGAIAANAASYTIANLPAGATNAACVLQGSTTPCSGTAAGISGNTLTALLPAIATGATAHFVVTYDLPATAPAATYSLAHDVTGAGMAANQQQTRPLVVVSASSLPAAGQATISTVETPTFVEATVVINNLGQASAISGAQYSVAGLPTGIASITCTSTPAGLCGAPSVTYDAGTDSNTHAVLLNPIAANTLAIITFRYPVGATTPGHTGTHRIGGGGMTPQISVQPFALRSSGNGAVSVPAVAPLGLLLLSLLAAGVPAAVARRRRR